MAPLTDRNDRPREREPLLGSRFPRPLPIGRWADTQISLGWSLPVMVAAIVITGWSLRTRQGNADLPVLSGILAVAIVVGALWQAVIRLTTIRLLDGRAIDLTIRGFGSWGGTTGIGGWKRLLAGCLPPLASFALASWLAAMPPHGQGWAGISFDPLGLSGEFNAVSVVTATVSAIFLQSLVQCLPLPGCHGREAIAGLIETIGERWQPRSRRRTAKWLVGLIAVALLGACLWFLTMDDPGYGVPRWPFLALLSGACWASRRLHEFSLEETHRSPPYWLPPQAASHLVSPMEPRAVPAGAAGPENGRPTAVWNRPWKWYQQRKATRRLQEAHQRERTEATDAARLDEILEHLHADGFKALSAEEKAVLRRVSDRLRKDHS